MMAGNPSWWSMQSELRSTSDQQHHHHHHQHEQVVVEEEEEANNSNLFMSQTQHNHHHHHPSNNSLLPFHQQQQQQYLHGSSSSTSHSSSLMPFISLVDHQHAQDFPHSWSQLLLGGMASEQEEERFSTTAPSHFQSTRVMSNDVKAEVNTPTSNNNNSNNNNNNLYESQYLHEEQQQEGSSSVGISNNNNNNNNNNRAWTQLMPVSSPKSCITSLNNNINTTNDNNINTNNNNNNNNNNINISTSNNNNSMLDFSTNKRALQVESHQHADHSNSECNSPATTGGLPLPKKPRLQSSSNPPLKVRKEKLGDRITSLHQLVSPFGKTDTASVLLEAIGYIRFLQGQIEALSSPYLGSNTPSMKNTHNIHGERTCLFPDHPGQLLNDSCLKRRGAANQEEKEGGGGRKDELKSRGLCLVPISCTQLIGSENGADYWAQSLGGGF